MNSTPKTGRPHLGERAKHTLRLPLELDQALRQRADAHGRGVNAELVAILTAVLRGTPASAADAYVNKAARWKKPGTPVRDLEPLAH